MAQSPTSRTLQYCRKHNMVADVCERYNSFTKTRHDLFGFLDMIVLDNQKMIGVQVTSTSNMSARRKKILNERRDQALAWLNAGGEIGVWGWGKKKQGKRNLWTLKKTEITLEDFEEGE